MNKNDRNLLLILGALGLFLWAKSQNSDAAVRAAIAAKVPS